MRVRVAIMGLILAVAASVRPAVADDDLAEIDRLLSDSHILRAGFEQERHMAVLANPLRSQGRLTYDSGKGVLWQVTQPFPVVVVLRANEILEWTDDSEPRRLDLGSNPVYMALASVFFSALAGTSQGLEEGFDIEASVDGETWDLILIPKDALLATAIKEVELHGGRYVESVRISEARGDETMIRFSDFSETPETLHESERRFFAE
jgi:hypothetical protein